MLLGCKAQASARSYLQEEAIREHLEKARQRVAEMGDPRNEESSPKAKQAQERARREQQERLEGALEELQKWQARKSGEKAKRETRVSTSDPQARAMHQPDGGLALSYNPQISADAAQGLIVGVTVRRNPTTADSYCQPWSAWKNGWRKSRSRWWPTAATPR
jgi:hypothetical protein